ncbi:DUF4349 domain-containing protein [Homoserinimonas sp. A520]
MRLRLLRGTVLVTALVLTGCSASGASLVGASSTDVAPQSGPEFADSVVGFEDLGAVGADSAARLVDGDQKMIVTGYLVMTVERPAEAAAEVATIVERAGGRVDARSETAPDGEDKGRAELTVRIPSDQLTQTLASLKELGTVERVEQEKQNVTAQVRDLDSRIKALHASVDRLIALMADADTTADLISIESALSERQANLESLESQKRSLDDLVELSTYTIQLGTEEDAPVDEPDTFLSGLAAGWEAFVGFFGFLLVAFGVLLPWLALVGLATIVIVVVARRRVKTTPADVVEGL